MLKTSERLLALLSMLHARRDWPGALLASRLDVSPRTVRRDIDRLRELGYRVAASKGPYGGYRLEAGSDLPPLLFDDDQAVALAVALQVATISSAGIADDSQRALNTIRQVMPSRLQHRIDAMTITAVPDRLAKSSNHTDSKVLMRLGAAVHARTVLRLRYGGTTYDETTERRVEPHHLVTWASRWYLIAWDLDRDDWRTFRTDRMTAVTPAGPRFSSRHLPGNDVAQFIAGRFRGTDHRDGRWPCRGEAVVHLPAAAVAPYVTDGIVEPLGAARCRVVDGSWSWSSLAASFGRFDADLEAVSPDELRDAFVTLSRRYASLGELRKTP